jgi:hypothetical protein
MPEKKKEVQSCHLCGVEAIDECEMHEGHIPFDETLPPCVYCVRNASKRDAPVRMDFYDKMWTLESDRTPILEDPDPQEQKLLKTLHAIVNGGEKVAV